MTMNVLADIQRDLINKDLVANIRAEVLTPILIGGYDARRYHPELGLRENLRESSLRGVWRWWARALIGAAIQRTDLTIRELDTIVSLLLGSPNESSKYLIRVELEEHDSPDNEIRQLKNCKCISFAKLEGEIEDSVEPGSFINITLYRNRPTHLTEDRFAVISLIIGLVFEGIGKRVSRGFGKLRIIDVISRVTQLNRFPKINETNPEKIKSEYIELLNEGVNAAKELLRLSEYKERLNELLKRKSNTTSELKLPLVEIPDVEKCFTSIRIFNKQFNDYVDALKVICCAVLKLSHKALIIYREGREKERVLERARNRKGYDVNTWILGLPRAQEPPIVKIKEGLNSNKVRDEIREKLRRALEEKLRQLIRDEKVLNRIINEFCNKVILKRKGSEIAITIPTGYYVVNIEKGTIENVRRKSPIRFTITKVGSKYFIVMHSFKTIDWLVESRKRKLKLLHIGAEPVRRGKTVVNIREFNVNAIDLTATVLESSYNQILSGIINLIEKDLYEVICK